MWIGNTTAEQYWTKFLTRELKAVKGDWIDVKSEK